MSITANNIDRKSWLEVPVDTDFPIQNIPFGVFLTKENVVTVGTRIGDFAIDLGALQQLNYFEGIELTDDMFLQDTLNDFISDGKKTWRLVRNRIADIFDEKNPKLRDNKKDKDKKHESEKMARFCCDKRKIKVHYVNKMKMKIILLS